MEPLAAVYKVHLWFILLMAGASLLAIAVAVVTAIIATRMRNR